MLRLLICFIVLILLQNQILAADSIADVTLPAPPYCGGKPAVGNTNPWLAYVLRRPYFSTVDTRCAGSLINSRWILTAAHCVSGFVKLVEFGDHTAAHVDRKIIHPEYHVEDIVKKSNIALLRLTAPINYTQAVQPICLPQNKEISSNDNTEAKIVFWTQLPEAISSSRMDHKVEATVQLLSSESCQAALKSKNLPFDDKHQLCIDHRKCLKNDGKILQQKINGVYYQIGLMTYKSVVCETAKDFSNVFNRIDTFVEWIAETIKNNQ